MKKYHIEIEVDDMKRVQDLIGEILLNSIKRHDDIEYTCPEMTYDQSDLDALRQLQNKISESE